MSPAHQSGRRRYAERAADETLRQADRFPAVDASAETVLLTGDEADALLLSETAAQECRRCGEVEMVDEIGLCSTCRASIRHRCPEARL